MKVPATLSHSKLEQTNWLTQAFEFLSGHFCNPHYFFISWCQAVYSKSHWKLVFSWSMWPLYFLFLASFQIPWRKQRQENVSDNYNLFSSTELWGCKLSNHFSINISMDKVARVYVSITLQGKRHLLLSLMAYKNNTIIAIIDPFNKYYVPSTVLSNSFIHSFTHSSMCVEKLLQDRIYINHPMTS